jgi:hypothetical protein
MAAATTRAASVVDRQVRHPGKKSGDRIFIDRFQADLDMQPARSGNPALCNFGRHRAGLVKDAG